MLSRSFLTALVAYLPLVLAAPTSGVINANAKDIVPNEYIVVLKESASDSAISAHKATIEQVHSASALERRTTLSGIKNSYRIGKFKGYSGEFDAATLRAIAKSPEVAYIEASQVYRTQDIPFDTGKVGSMAEKVSQYPAPSWGLYRISHEENQPARKDYVYDSTAGEGSTVYVIDTGIYIDHPEFEGRAKWGRNFVNSIDKDENGHGTHCAGTIGSKSYGVAKKANLVAVKVLNAAGSGSTIGITNALSWIAGEIKRTGDTKAALSMSLGGGFSSALNSAVQAVIDAGAPACVAAGNDNANAANYSPASTASAITVGASNITDERSYFSNYGPVVDIFAPGHNILSTWIGGPSAVKSISGTSMATPHCAGVVAYLFGTGELNADNVKSAPSVLASRGLKGVLTRIPSGTANVLLNNGEL